MMDTSVAAVIVEPEIVNSRLQSPTYGVIGVPEVGAVPCEIFWLVPFLGPSLPW